MVRKELFEKIREVIGHDVPSVKHIALWNENVTFIDEDDAWERPAVFVEFGAIQWSPFKANVHRGTGTVRLHIVTDYVDGGDTAGFALSSQLKRALDGLRRDTFGPLRLNLSVTNHNHEEILETVDEYLVNYLLVV